MIAQTTIQSRTDSEWGHYWASDGIPEQRRGGGGERLREPGGGPGQDQAPGRPSQYTGTVR